MAGSITEAQDTLKTEDLVYNLRGIESGLKQTVANLRHKLDAIDSEPELKSIIAKLKKDAEKRASDLEAEVNHLREELKYIKGDFRLRFWKAQSSGFLIVIRYFFKYPNRYANSCPINSRSTFQRSLASSSMKLL